MRIESFGCGKQARGLRVGHLPLPRSLRGVSASNCEDRLPWVWLLGWNRANRSHMLLNRSRIIVKLRVLPGYFFQFIFPIDGNHFRGRTWLSARSRRDRLKSSPCQWLRPSSGSCGTENSRAGRDESGELPKRDPCLRCSYKLTPTMTRVRAYAPVSRWVTFFRYLGYGSPIGRFERSKAAPKHCHHRHENHHGIDGLVDNSDTEPDLRHHHSHLTAIPDPTRMFPLSRGIARHLGRNPPSSTTPAAIRVTNANGSAAVGKTPSQSKPGTSEKGTINSTTPW
jgi:hypothetical protein